MSTTKQKQIKALADSVLGYLIDDGRKRQDFEDQFADQDWDDEVVEKVLGMAPDTLTEEQAAIIAQSCLRDKTTSLCEVIAYHCMGSHIYSDAVKLRVLMGLQKEPKLKDWELEHINQDLKDIE